MSSQLAMLSGAFRYEFRMQIRRPSLWITFIVITALLLLEFNQGTHKLNIVIPYNLAHYPLLSVIAQWTFNITNYLPICVGALLADRLVRDRRTKVDEIFTTMPAQTGIRLLGKYFGSITATIIPMFVIYMVVIGYILYLTHNWLVIPLALETFVVITLPGILFISAFSLACPLLMWVPLYQFLFICYWFWNTLWFHKEIFNLGRTVLSPLGLYTAYGFYGLRAMDDLSGPHGDHGIHSDGLLATANIAVLLGIAFLVLFLLERSLKWYQAHR